MEKKEVQVDCPECGMRLLVDVRTGKILRSSRASEIDETGKTVVREEDWDSARDRVQSRLSSAEDKFDSGLNREKNREQDLDDLFRRASEKLHEEDED